MLRHNVLYGTRLPRIPQTDDIREENENLPYTERIKIKQLQYITEVIFRLLLPLQPLYPLPPLHSCATDVHQILLVTCQCHAKSFVLFPHPNLQIHDRERQWSSDYPDDKKIYENPFFESL